MPSVALNVVTLKRPRAPSDPLSEQTPELIAVSDDDADNVPTLKVCLPLLLFELVLNFVN